MYKLLDPLEHVRGIGAITAQKLAKKGLKTVQDLLLFLPLNYTDLSQVLTIGQLKPNQVCTIKAQVISVREYFKNSKRITRATIADETGRTECIWFNNRFIKQQLKKGQDYFFAGSFNDYRNFSQPKVEAIKQETLHTGRLVPRYSQTLDIKQGKMRLILKEILDHLNIKPDFLSENSHLLSLAETFSQLHYPQEKELVIKARKRLAIEELLALMKKSQQIKKEWQQQQAMVVLDKKQLNSKLIPKNIPFELTQDQMQAIKEIAQDLEQQQPMNRLLIGDVGSGKTVVAAIVAWHILSAGFNAALIAPTQILAEQHQQTLNSILPQIPTKLLTAKTSKKQNKKDLANKKMPTLFIGTHAVINQLDQIQPGLIIYDEQHRFGVAQRASIGTKKTLPKPHVLTMSATPIPRSYMLTIFSHLDVSLIKEFPFGEKRVKTWYVPKQKRNSAYQWTLDQLKTPNTFQKKKEKSMNNEVLDDQQPLALIICPFINPSDIQEFEKIPAASEIYQLLEKKWNKEVKVVLLHGQQKPDRQERIIKQLFDQKINVLVATSIVEVGIDLPQANIILIEGADRFGLASLHQLRGRVGRKSQESYCLVFNSSNNQTSAKRLQLFAQENDGLKLAELDLKNRGPGDLFGLQQHGLDNLRFASWNNLELIAQAKQIFNQLEQKKGLQKHNSWRPLFEFENFTPEKISNN